MPNDKLLRFQAASNAFCSNGFTEDEAVSDNTPRLVQLPCELPTWPSLTALLNRFLTVLVQLEQPLTDTPSGGQNLQHVASPPGGENPQLNNGIDQLTAILREISLLVRDEPPSEEDRQGAGSLFKYIH